MFHIFAGLTYHSGNYWEKIYNFMKFSSSERKIDVFHTLYQGYSNPFLSVVGTFLSFQKAEFEAKGSSCGLTYIHELSSSSWALKIQPNEAGGLHTFMNCHPQAGPWRFNSTRLWGLTYIHVLSSSSRALKIQFNKVMGGGGGKGLTYIHELSSSSRALKIQFNKAMGGGEAYIHSCIVILKQGLEDPINKAMGGLHTLMYCPLAGPWRSNPTRLLEGACIHSWIVILKQGLDNLTQQSYGGELTYIHALSSSSTALKIQPNEAGWAYIHSCIVILKQGFKDPILPQQCYV